MPDGPGHPQFESLEIYILPTQCKQLANAKAGRRIKQDKGSFPKFKPGKKQSQLREFEDIRYPLPLCALTHEFNWITIYPLVAHCVMKKGAHQISNLSPCSLCPLNAVQPFFHGNWCYLDKPDIAPTRQDPVLQVAFVARTRRKRLPSATPAGQLLQPIVRNEL